MFGIGNQLLSTRMNDDVHCLHRNGAKQNLISEDACSGQAVAALRFYLDRTHVANLVNTAVGNPQFAWTKIRQLKPLRDVFRNDKIDRAAIHKCGDGNFFDIGPRGVA